MDVDTNDLAAGLAESLRPDRVGSYTAFAIRTRSPLAPEVLRAAGQEAAYARYVALSGAPDAHSRGLELLDRIVAREGVTAQRPEIATLYAQLLVRSDRREELHRLLNDPQVPLKALGRWSLRTDLVNPHGARPAGPPADVAAAEDQWLAVLNEIHQADALDELINAFNEESGVLKSL